MSDDTPPPPRGLLKGTFFAPHIAFSSSSSQQQESFSDIYYSRANQILAHATFAGSQCGGEEKLIRKKPTIKSDLGKLVEIQPKV